MRKLILNLIIVSLTLVSCSSDDNNDHNPVDIIDKDNTILKGKWELVEILYMDANNNIIEEVPASNNQGCGKTQLEITDDFFFYKFPILVNNNCEQDNYSFQYEIKNKFIINLTDDQKLNIKEEIVIVNEAWLSIKETGDDVDYQVFKGLLPENTKSLRYEYKKL